MVNDRTKARAIMPTEAALPRGSRGFEDAIARLGGAPRSRQSDGNARQSSVSGSSFAREPAEENNINPRLHNRNLQSEGVLPHSGDMDVEKLSALFAQLNEENQQKLYQIAVEFKDAVADAGVEPVLVKLPKLESGDYHGIWIKNELLPDLFVKARREATANRTRDYRKNMTPEKAAEAREKAAAKMRELRKKRKENSDQLVTNHKP